MAMTSACGVRVGGVVSRTAILTTPALEFPAASVAVHVTSVSPSGKVEPGAGVQASLGARSRLSVAAKLTIAPAGEEASTATSPGSTGAVTSTVQLKVVGGLWPPVESNALTWKVCRPSARDVYDTGDVHGPQPAAPESRRQLKLAVSGDPESANVALVSSLQTEVSVDTVGLSGAATSLEAATSDPLRTTPTTARAARRLTFPPGRRRPPPRTRASGPWPVRCRRVAPRALLRSRRARAGGARRRRAPADRFRVPGQGRRWPLPRPRLE